MPSPTFNYAIHAISSTDSPLLLLEFNHSAINQIRLVNDNQNITSNNKVYSKSSFQINLPNQGEKQNPTASIAIDTQDVIARAIQQVHGAIDATVSLKYIMRSTPDIIENSYTFNVGNITLSTTINITLTFNNLLDLPFIKQNFRPENAEALFI